MTSLSAQSLRDLVHMYGSATMTVDSCGPLTGLKEIIELAPVTVEGTITLAESKLTAEEDDVYSEYEMDVIRMAHPSGPTLSVGQHIIVSAYFDQSKGWWSPFGFFEVQDGRVVNIDNRVQTTAYNSVEEFAAALANPPPTTLPSTR